MVQKELVTKWPCQLHKDKEMPRVPKVSSFHPRRANLPRVETVTSRIWRGAGTVEAVQPVVADVRKVARGGQALVKVHLADVADPSGLAAAGVGIKSTTTHRGGALRVLSRACGTGYQGIFMISPGLRGLSGTSPDHIKLLTVVLIIRLLDKCWGFLCCTAVDDVPIDYTQRCQILLNLKKR